MCNIHLKEQAQVEVASLRGEGQRRPPLQVHRPNADLGHSQKDLDGGKKMGAEAAVIRGVAGKLVGLSFL